MVGKSTTFITYFIGSFSIFKCQSLKADLLLKPDINKLMAAE